MELENPDPRGEYFRICPYCSGEFIADHMNCIYCPEKNGKKNWCKNRHKRVRQEKLREAVVDHVITCEELEAKWNERKEKAKKAAKKHKTVSVSEQIGNNIASAVGMKIE